MLFFCTFLADLEDLIVQLNILLVEVDLVNFETIDLLSLIFDLFFKLFLLSNELVDSVVLAQRKTGALLNNLVELGDLVLQTLNDLPCFLFFLLGSFD